MIISLSAPVARPGSPKISGGVPRRVEPRAPSTLAVRQWERLGPTIAVEARRGRDCDLRVDVPAFHAREVDIVVAIPVAVVGDPGRALTVEGHSRFPVIGGAACHVYFRRPALAIECLEKNIAVLPAEALP